MIAAVVAEAEAISLVDDTEAERIGVVVVERRQHLAGRCGG